MIEQHIGRRIARAMITIFIFQIFWKFGGFIVKTLILRQFGTTEQSHVLDAYMFAESTVIWTLYVVFDKFIFPTFIPLFSEERELRGEDDAWRFANSFVNLLMLVLLGVLTACAVWAPQVVDFIARRWIVGHPDTAALAIRLSRWMLPALFFVVLGSFTHALLNAHKRFAYAQAGMGMHRFVHALIFIVAFQVFGATAIWAALAFTLAAPAKLITHFVGLKEKLRNYRPWVPHWRQIGRPALRWLVEYALVAGALLACNAIWGRPDVYAYEVIALGAAVIFFAARGLISWLLLRRVAEKTLMQKLYLLGYPVLMGVLIARLRDLVQDSYATHLEQSGFFGAIKYAKSVGELPMALIPLALSMAMFPFLCDMFTKQNVKELSNVVSGAIKMIVLFFLPLTIVVVVLRLPVIELLASGKVEAGLVDATALALALYALGFIFYATEMVLMQSFFSLQNTWLPTLVGAVASFGQIGLLYVAFDVLEGPGSAAKTWLGHVGVTPLVAVALAYPLSRAFKNIILGAALHKRLKLFHIRDGMSFVPQVALLSATTGLAALRWLAVGSLAKWTLINRLVALGAPFEKMAKVTLTVKGEGILVPTGAPSGMTHTLGNCVALAIPSLAALVVFVGLLLIIKRIGWPVVEFDIILKWLHETGWQKIKGKLKGKNK